MDCATQAISQAVSKLIILGIQRDLSCRNRFNGSTSCGELPVQPCLTSTELQNSAVQIESAAESLRLSLNRNDLDYSNHVDTSVNKVVETSFGDNYDQNSKSTSTEKISSLKGEPDFCGCTCSCSKTITVQFW